jgi:hypothetical protein
MDREDRASTMTPPARAGLLAWLDWYRAMGATDWVGERPLDRRAADPPETWSPAAPPSSPAAVKAPAAPLALRSPGAIVELTPSSSSYGGSMHQKQPPAKVALAVAAAPPPGLAL